MSEILWRPSESQVTSSEVMKYITWLNDHYKLAIKNYDELYEWSIKKTSLFWTSLIQYFDIQYEGDLSLEEDQLKFMSDAWFPNMKLNFSQNLLSKGNPDRMAISFFHESGLEKKISYKKLKSDVSKLAHYLKEFIKEDDVVAAYMPNTEHTVTTMLATAAIGGIFTSTSCDFGVGGVVDRFGQSKPKVLIAATYYTYNQKVFNQMDKIEEIINKIPSIEKVILVDFLERENQGKNVKKDHRFISYENIINEGDDNTIEYKLRKFSDPLYIMYSSGTTGTPKCIVHSTGGVLLQHLKELSFHTNLTSDKNIFYFTTCGWMMWNWLVSALALGSGIGLYEGSLAYPSLEEFMKKIDDAGFHIWGTSPKFLKVLEDSGYNKNFNFKNLEVILSTGAPLLPEQFDFVYDKIKKDIQLSSISGGTDILGCFMLGSPVKNVIRGEIQTRGLGMKVESFDHHQKPVRNKEGELVCLKSFPSQPIYFLNDKDYQKYQEAYFTPYGHNIWCHGDFITITKSGGVIVHGRSDATLNPGGVRIGTAEIYRQVESLSFIEDSLCVGKNEEGDVNIALFVKLKNNMTLTEDKVKEIKTIIRKKTTPRHVPRYILPVTGIPYTRSGKKMELAVNRLINGRKITNREAVSNPECLEQYEKAFT